MIWPTRFWGIPVEVMEQAAANGLLGGAQDRVAAKPTNLYTGIRAPKS